MKSYHGSISTVENSESVLFGYGHLIFAGERNFIKILSDNCKDQEWSLLLGSFSNPEYRNITFLNCKTGGYTKTKLGFNYKIYYEYTLTESRFLSLDNIMFKEVCLYLPSLTRWLHHSEFSGKFAERMAEELVVIPREQQVSKSTIGSMDIAVLITYPYTWGDEKFEIEKSSLVVFNFSEKEKISLILEKINKFKKLFLFLTNWFGPLLIGQNYFG